MMLYHSKLWETPLRGLFRYDEAFVFAHVECVLSANKIREIQVMVLSPNLFRAVLQSLVTKILSNIGGLMHWITG